TASSLPLRVASPRPDIPSSVVILSVTKLRPGLQTITLASVIFIAPRRRPLSRVYPPGQTPRGFPAENIAHRSATRPRDGCRIHDAGFQLEKSLSRLQE